MGIVNPQPITEREPGPYPANRRCSHPDCITLLNRWHEGDRCYQHAPPVELTDRQVRQDFGDLLGEIMEEAA
jgi:hypothetical protein